MEKIPYSKQSVDSSDVNSVIDVLNDSFITQGPKVNEFERKFAKYCDAKYAVAVSNGTSALTIANKALGLQKNDKVITTPNTFVATANSIALNEALPYLVDINSDDFNISVKKINHALNSNSNFKGVIPVHFAGVLADIESISLLAKKFDVYVLEDACHALGGTWVDSNGVKHKVGDCSYSDMTVFSFHPVKQITTGEGGMITTNSESHYHQLLSLRSHGICKPDRTDHMKLQPWYYEMTNLSGNHRITDIQCALGISQLKKNKRWCKKRSEIVGRYESAFSDLSMVSSQSHSNSGNTSFHLYVIKAKDRDNLYRFLHEKGIAVQVHYIPVHFHPYYQKQFGYKKGDFQNCENYYGKALSLPLYPTLKDSEQDFVISSIKDFYNER